MLPTSATLLRLLIIAGLAFVWDVATTWLTLGLVVRDLRVVIPITFSLPFVAFCQSHWFIEAKEWKPRLVQTLAAAVGMTLGALVSLWLWGQAR